MCDNSEFNITTQRFRELIDNEKYAKVPRAEIAKALNCDTSTITKYYNGQRQLSVDSIIKFSKYFNVSSDYLLGLTDVPSKLKADDDIAVRICCDYTNLSISSIKILHSLKNKSYINFANQLIDFIDVNMWQLHNYFYSLSVLQNVYDDKKDYIETRQHSDDVLLIPELYPNNLHLQVAQYNLLNSFNKLINNENTEKLLKWCEYYILITEKLSNKQQNNNIDDDLPF